MEIRKSRIGTAVALLALPLAGCATGGTAADQDVMVAATGGSAAQLVAGWPETARMAANDMMEKYGQPDEATPTRMVWFDTGPWKRTIVYRDEVEHRFPMPHRDVLEQFVDYDVPPEMFDELAMYDGSVIVERTKGEISARCDREAANFLAINLANGIINGEYTVEQARDTYAAQIMAMKNNRPAPLTEGFVFPVPRRDINNPDQPHPMMRGMQ